MPMCRIRWIVFAARFRRPRVTCALTIEMNVSVGFCGWNRWPVANLAWFGDGIGPANFEFDPQFSRTIEPLEHYVGLRSIAKQLGQMWVEYLNLWLASPSARTLAFEAILKKLCQGAH